MLENKLNTNKNVLLPEQERRQENNKNYDNTTQFTFKRKKNTTTTFKSKKESLPIPMKLRALPESFWQQPNEPSQHLPSTIYPDLSVLAENEDNSGFITNDTTTTTNNEIVSTANTELLFSLFSVVDTNKCQMSVIRRGRPKKPLNINKNNKNKNVLRDKDPCLISTVTEALLPLLPERKKNTLNSFIEQQAFLTLSVNTDRSATGQTYSNLLSEVVVRL